MMKVRIVWSDGFESDHWVSLKTRIRDLAACVAGYRNIDAIEILDTAS